jgi:glycosyltransferase involved in cell wall biosynthesis
MLLPLVTIAIPAYKSTFLRETISSALKQTYSNIELIVVDDNSPENIDSIIKEFNDSRIHYYKNAINLGKEDPSKNWNKCLEYANGEYFALLCDDDTYEPTFIEEMIELAQIYPNVAVFRARVRTIDENNNLINWYPASPTFETCFDYMYQKMSGFRRQTISEFFYNTNYIKALAGYTNAPRAWTADSLSVYKFAWESGIASTQKILVNFRESSKNISSIYTDALAKLDALLLFRKKISDFISKLENQAEKKFLRDALYCCIFNEIVGMSSHSSLINICKIILKGGFPRKWALFILTQKIGTLGNRK